MLREIGKSILALRSATTSDAERCEVGGRFIAQALKHGAFTSSHHVRLRNHVEMYLSSTNVNPFISAWAEAAHWLRKARDLPIAPDISKSFRKDCEIIGKTILAEAHAQDESSMDEGVGDTPVTLRGFMRLFCKPLSKNLSDSRIRSLQSAARRGEVQLPRYEGNWKPGQSKKYRPSALIKAWPDYRNILPNLPELKRS